MTRLARHAFAIWLVLMLMAGWIAARSTYVADLSAFLPAAPSAEQRVLLEQLRHGTTARVMMIGIRGRDAAGRADASRRLAAALRASGEFDAVHNGDRGDWQSAGEFIFAHRYLLSPAVDAKRFTVEGLKAGIAETLSLLGTPAGSLVKPLLWRDPTGETVRIAEAITPAAAPRIEEGVWASRSEPRAVLLATTHADGADLDGQARAIDAVKRAFAPLAAGGLELDLSGAGVLSVQSRAQIESEVRRLGTLDTLALVALLGLAFGSLRMLGIAMLPVASGVLAGIVAVSLAYGQVHGITLAFGTTLIGEAVDYSIYYLVQARPARRAGDGSGAPAGHLRWLALNWPTVRLGLLTSLAGFAALVFSGFGGLSQLGTFSLAGLVAAALTTRHVLLRLAPDGARGSAVLAPLGRATRLVTHALPRCRWPLAALALAACAWVLLQPSAWHGTLAGLSPVRAAQMRLDASLRADLGAADAGALVAIEAPDEATALARAEEAGAHLDALVDKGLLLGYDSPARLLPSPTTQQGRRAALPDADTLRRQLAPAAAEAELPLARLDAFVADVQSQRAAPIVTLASLSGTALHSAVQAQLVPGRDGRPWTVLLNLHLPGATPNEPDGTTTSPASGAKATPVPDAGALRDALAGLPDTRLVLIQPELDTLYARYLHEGLWQALLGAATVLVLLLVHLRSWRRLLRVAAPLAASVALVLAGLTAAGVALGVLHLVGFLLVVAVGSNYALFFDHIAESPGRGEAAGDETLASLLLANLATVITFGLLASSSVPALFDIGLVVGPGALLCLLLAAAFIGPRPSGLPEGLVGKSRP